LNIEEYFIFTPIGLPLYWSRHISAQMCYNGHHRFNALTCSVVVGSKQISDRTRLME